MNSANSKPDHRSSKIRRFGPIGRKPLSPDPISPFSQGVPASIQASLLQVGMRVRKSVPEGYKTITSKNLSHPYSYAPHGRIGNELAPFGGGKYGEEAGDENMELDMFPPSSQESTATVDSATLRPAPLLRKRSYGYDDDEGPGENDFSAKQEFLNEKPPPSRFPSGDIRSFAIPKSRKALACKSPTDMNMRADGQSSRMDEEFGEADFLVFDETM